MHDLEHCELCEWRCGANRLAGEQGVCRVGLPEVAATMCSATLHSYSVTLLGCCYRCLHCNAYRISQYPDPRWWYGGYVDPETLVAEALARIRAHPECEIDTVGFTGGDPIIHLPYLEAVKEVLDERAPGMGVSLSTGGFPTRTSMDRIIDLCSRVTLEIKAFDDEVHRALTGAPVEPVIRNATYLAARAPEKIRVFRTVVIPGITEGQVEKIAGFIAGLDPAIPYRLIGFRPNNVLYYHQGPSAATMEHLARLCRDAGLTDVAWSGYYPSAPESAVAARTEVLSPRYHGDREAALCGAYASLSGCPTHPRDCGACSLRTRCPATLREPWNRR